MAVGVLALVSTVSCKKDDDKKDCCTIKAGDVTSKVCSDDDLQGASWEQVKMTMKLQGADC